jgi:urease accessory protein UreF/urease accessory protein UreH
MSGKSSDILRKSVKHGIGRLTASADALSRKRTTRLTQVAHKSPTRLIPIRKTSVQTAGAAVCALSNYGAGRLQGDSSELSVPGESGAKLGVVTQGAARIYTQRIPGECKANMDVRVEKDGVLVYAPDPCAMFASSSYSQIQEYNIHPESSIALIDWISSGRFKNQERWEFDKLNVRTTLKWLDDTETIAEKSEKEVSHNTVNDAPYNDIPFLQDSISIDLRSNRKYSNQSEHHDLHAVQDFNCFASLIIYGEHMEPVKDECQFLSDSFAAQYTRIRQRDQRDQNHTKLQAVDVGDFNLSGRVVMGVSKVALPGKPSDVHVFRCAGKTNEDIYRIFHHCLKPLAPSFGFEFYKDRILAQRSEIPTQGQGEEEAKSTETTKDVKSTQTPAKIDPFPLTPLDSHSKPLGTSSSFWSIVMLADSGLPTGSFAHSAGLEAAAQLGMIRSEEDVRTFIHAATRSSIQLLAPFLVAGLRIAQDDNRDGHTADTMRVRWEKLHRECQAVMVTNQPACSASLDQGKSLVRVASQWLSGAEESSSSSGIDNSFLKHLKNGSPPHIAPSLGVIGGLLGLDEIQVCRLFAYCMARDLVSSAVRLSLIGPLASVPLLHNLQESVENGICAVYHDIQNHPNDPLLVAASSAPVIEAIHPCHEILQVRLFRS